MRHPKFTGAIIAILAIVALPSAQIGFGATYKVLHAFTGTADGAGLYGSPVLDSNNNLYGVTSGGGAHGEGTVFQLTPVGGGNWTKTTIYDFCPQPHCPDGALPNDALTVDSAGNLYGPTSSGGPGGLGSVFQLSPGPDGWTFTLLADIGSPPLTLGARGNLYGEIGPGKCAHGEILKLIPPRNGGNWTTKDLYDFCPHNNKWGKGYSPNYGLSWDTSGNLYGIAGAGGKENQGLVFQLEHTPKGWNAHVLHNFHYLNQDADTPYGGVVVDSTGNVYGSTLQGGSDRCGGPGCGTIYKLTKQPDGHWKETLLFEFPKWAESGDPVGTLAMDAAGNLYGVAGGGRGQCNCGVVFKFAHNPDDTWTYTILHRFQGTDGAYPQAGVILDAKGNIYGTTLMGGKGGAGVVFKIAQ